ncbi:MAG: TonB-dependent receptor [Marivirga sp.]|jgi:TonB-dependent receptor
MQRIYSLLVILFITASTTAFSQQGAIRGTVTDASNGEGLFGVNVVIDGTSIGAVTDFDGKFEIKTQVGTYTIKASFVTYRTVTISEVIVASGEVFLIDNIALVEDVEQLGEVVVTAKAIRSTSEALLMMKRKSPSMMDGISAASFRKIGDSDAAAAVKRVTGVSVEGGKYVYVRGLGDRYTKTMLNGVDIPGLDPDKNSLQIDIFPTNLIDNMMVSKTAVGEMPADFTGGIVNIETKDFPEERVFNVSVGVGFNPSMHLNEDYIAYEGSNTDFLGFDNGARALPALARNSELPSPINSNYTEEQVFDFNNSFNPTLGATQQTSFMDYSLGLSGANQISLENGHKLGYIFSATYKSSTKFYDDIIFGEYQNPIASEEYDLVYATTQNGVIGEKNILLSGLGGLAYKTRYSKYRLTAMHLQNGESRSAQMQIDNSDSAPGQSGYSAYSNNLEYSQRGLTNILLNGNHYSSDNKWEVDWRVSPTFSNIVDPDIRKTAFTISSQGDPIFSAGAGGRPSRIWRYLNEVNVVGKVDVTHKYDVFGEESKLKFGVSHVYKQRDYEILSYDLQSFGRNPDWTGNPNEVLDDANIYDNGALYYASGNVKPNPNEYNSNINNLGVYLTSDFTFFTGFKATLGIRGENYVQRHTGRDVAYVRDQNAGNNLVNEKVLDAFDLFPSANLIYSLSETQNLRGSYSKTIARPSFKELSFAQILDPITNRIFNGSLFQYSDWDGKLTETRIDNIDLRWELFMGRSQMISASLFYKVFDNPIEMVRIPEAQTSNEFQPRNVGDGSVVGAEFEFIKSLDFISPALSKLSLNGNFTYVKSQIRMTETELDSRKNFEKSGQTISGVRDMAGQAPYILNAGISFQDPEREFDAGLYYNVKGATLVIVGGGLFPDVYSEPFHSLNFNMNKSFGVEGNSSIGLNVSNILNDVYEEFYKGFNATPEYFSRRGPGMNISLQYSFAF